MTELSLCTLHPLRPELSSPIHALLVLVRPRELFERAIRGEFDLVTAIAF
jgi:hypothetical protein